MQPHGLANTLFLIFRERGPQRNLVIYLRPAHQQVAVGSSPQ